MAKCDVCGNDYDKAFQVVSAQGSSRTFDSFECAIQRTCPDMRPLPLQDHRARHRGARHILLLRALCQASGVSGRRRSRATRFFPSRFVVPCHVERPTVLGAGRLDLLLLSRC